MSKVTRVLVLPDMQVPYHDTETLKAVEKFMKDYRWDHYINLGDFMDFDCISHHTKGKLRVVEGKRVMKDYAVGNEILDRHQQIVRKRNKNAKFVLLEGNHEFRVERYLDERPEMEGLVEVENGLRLKERGFKWVRCYKKGDIFTLGNANFHHGLYTNQFHSKKMVDSFGVNIFYGHLHDVQAFSKVMWGKDKTIVGQSMGCLCDYEQSYIKGNPTKWQQAFGVFEFQENGYFTYNVVRIFNHQFIYNGKVYKP